jgi:hypothetical protein
VGHDATIPWTKESNSSVSGLTRLMILEFDTFMNVLDYHISEHEARIKKENQELTKIVESCVQRAYTACRSLTSSMSVSVDCRTGL